MDSRFFHEFDCCVRIEAQADSDRHQRLSLHRSQFVVLNLVEQRVVEAGTFVEGLRVADTAILKKVCNDLAERRAAIVNDVVKLASFFKSGTHRLGGSRVDFLILVIVWRGLVGRVDVNDALVNAAPVF